MYSQHVSEKRANATPLDKSGGMRKRPYPAKYHTIGPALDDTTKTQKFTETSYSSTAPRPALDKDQKSSQFHPVRNQIVSATSPYLKTDSWNFPLDAELSL